MYFLVVGCYFYLSIGYWCMPLTEQIAVVSTVLIPLARRTPQSAESVSSGPNHSREVIVSLLSCCTQQWSDSRQALIRYAHDPAYHGDDAVTNPGKYQEFYRKVDGLVFQFCGSSPAELALAITNTVVEGKIGSENLSILAILLSF